MKRIRIGNHLLGFLNRKNRENLNLGKHRIVNYQEMMILENNLQKNMVKMNLMIMEQRIPLRLIPNTYLFLSIYHRETNIRIKKILILKNLQANKL